MTSRITDCTTLNNGVQMPWFGLGVYKVNEGEEVETSVITALEAGYRSIDTAALYANEEGVGRALRASGVPREQVFVTTKVWNSDQGYESTLAAFDASRKRLGMDYVDLYLIHWPVKGKYIDTWRALVKLYQEGHVRAIGVSNFQIHHLKDVMQVSDVVPAVNQVEFHPRLTQKPLLEFCKANHVQLEAWAPLMRGGDLLQHETVKEIAARHGKTPAQVVLRWDLELGVVTIPKSVHKNRIYENADIFDFSLSADEVAAIDSLNQDYRTGADPDNFNF